MRAEIPFNEVKGVYQATKEDKKEYSPLWGFAALQSDALKSIRFNGNYEYNEADGKKDIPKDDIAALLKYLFPSPDHHNFVAYNDSGIGKVVAENPKIIDKILDVLTRSNISDIDHNKLAEIMRANITSIYLKENKKESLSNILDIIELNNNLIHEIKNISDKKEKRTRKNQLINELLDNDLKIIIKNIIDSEEDTPKDYDELLEHLVKNFNIYKDQFFNDVPIEIRRDGPILAETIAKAFLAQKEIANPDPAYKSKQLYPKNIVPAMLLAYFVRIANTRDDLKILTSVINPALLSGDFYTIDDYYSSDKDLYNLENNPEKRFFLLKGFEDYEQKFPKPAPYMGGVYCSHEKLCSFPDCGETSIRNFLTLLSPKTQNKKIDLAFLEKIGLRDSVINYFTKYTSLTPASTDDAHNEWAQRVSKLNPSDLRKLGLNDIQYGRSDLPGYRASEENDKGQARECEIKSNFSHIGVVGIINILNVLSKLIPNETLIKPWSEDRNDRLKEAAEKLDALCQILSTDNWKLDWSIDDKKELKDEFTSIVFSINQKKAYILGIKKGHFAFDQILTETNDWRMNKEEQNDWLQFFVPKHGLSYVYATHIEASSIQKLVKHIIDNKLEAFYPFLTQWIKRLPIDDLYTTHNLKLLIEYIQDEKLYKPLFTGLMNHELLNKMLYGNIYRPVIIELISITFDKKFKDFYQYMIDLIDGLAIDNENRQTRLLNIIEGIIRSKNENLYPFADKWMKRLPIDNENTQTILLNIIGNIIFGKYENLYPLADEWMKRLPIDNNNAQTNLLNIIRCIMRYKEEKLYQLADEWMKRLPVDYRNFLDLDSIDITELL